MYNEVTERGGSGGGVGTSKGKRRGARLGETLSDLPKAIDIANKSGRRLNIYQGMFGYPECL